MGRGRPKVHKTHEEYLASKREKRRLLKRRQKSRDDAYLEEHHFVGFLSGPTNPTAPKGGN